MTSIIKPNHSENFPNNEGRVNSKGMVAPPVPPKSHQTKFAGMKAIFERNAPHFQANNSNKTVSSNLGRTFGPTMRKLMEDGNLTFIKALTPLINNAATRGIVAYLHIVALIAALLMIKVE